MFLPSDTIITAAENTMKTTKKLIEASSRIVKEIDTVPQHPLTAKAPETTSIVSLKSTKKGQNLPKIDNTKNIKSLVSSHHATRKSIIAESKQTVNNSCFKS